MPIHIKTKDGGYFRNGKLTGNAEKSIDDHGNGIFYRGNFVNNKLIDPQGEIFEFGSDFLRKYKGNIENDKKEGDIEVCEFDINDTISNLSDSETVITGTKKIITFENDIFQTELSSEPISVIVVAHCKKFCECYPNYNIVCRMNLIEQ